MIGHFNCPQVYFWLFRKTHVSTNTMTTPWLDQLTTLTQKPSRLVLGLISGTSSDGVDVALCEICGAGLPSISTNPTKVTLKHFCTYPYPKEIHKKLISSVASLNSQDIAELHIVIGKVFAKAVEEIIKGAGSTMDSVDLVGSHGQTIYHHSGQPGHLASLQIGDGDVIAEKTGLPVICDFRARDIAAGGEGAPLTPYSDAILFGIGVENHSRAVLNLGGISNITILDPNPAEIIGFDTGPANAPLDRLARILTKQATHYDKDGAIARKGTINQSLLTKLLKDDSYLKQSPPKSTGIERYGDDFVAHAIELHGRADNDLMATLVEFIACSIAETLQKHLPTSSPQELIIAGGGSKNTFLIERLTEKIQPIAVFRSDRFGIPPDAREAIAFAILANDALFGINTSLPNVTGASRAVPLGKICLPLNA